MDLPKTTFNQNSVFTWEFTETYSSSFTQRDSPKHFHKTYSASYEILHHCVNISFTFTAVWKQNLQGFTDLPFHCCVKQFMVSHTCPWFFFFHFSAFSCTAVHSFSYITKIKLLGFLPFPHKTFQPKKYSHTLLCVFWFSFTAANTLFCSTPCGIHHCFHRLLRTQYIFSPCAMQ